MTRKKHQLDNEPGKEKYERKKLQKTSLYTTKKLFWDQNTQTLNLPPLLTKTKSISNQAWLSSDNSNQITSSISNKHGLKLYYNNVDSLSNKINELTEILKINNIDIELIN